MGLQDRGAAQPLRVRAQCCERVVVVVAPRACRRDHGALDAVLVQRRDQLSVGEAVGRRVARIVDQRHVGGEDMHVRVDLQCVGHAIAPWCGQRGSRPACLDHGGPHVDVGYQPRVELLRRAGLGLAAEIEHALAGSPALSTMARMWPVEQPRRSPSACRPARPANSSRPPRR